MGLRPPRKKLVRKGLNALVSIASFFVGANWIDSRNVSYIRGKLTLSAMEHQSFFWNQPLLEKASSSCLIIIVISQYLNDNERSAGPEFKKTIFSYVSDWNHCLVGSWVCLVPFHFSLFNFCVLGRTPKSRRGLSKEIYWAVFPVQVFHVTFGFLGETLNATEQCFPLAADYYVVRGGQVYL